MCFLLYFLFLCLGHNECAKPRSVNIALETVFEFNNKTDFKFVERVKDFLTNIKETIDNSDQDIDYQTRRFDSLTFTKFIEDSINIIKSYNDLDLAYFIELLDTEINEHDYRNCEVKITNEFSLRSYFADKLSDARDLPVTEIRRSLDNILRELRSKREHRRKIYNFLNSLVKRRTQERFRSILNYLQLYRRRQMEPTITLRTIVEKSIRSLIKDYICNLNYSSWRKIRNMIKMLNDNSKIHVKQYKNDYKWNQDDMRTGEENDELYDLDILKDVFSNPKKDDQINTENYIRNQNLENKVQDRAKAITKKRKGKVNISLTNSEDVLDLGIDYQDDQGYSNKNAWKKEYYDVTTKRTFKIKTKRTRKPKTTENEMSLSNNRDSESSIESKRDRSKVFETNSLSTNQVRRVTKNKRHRSFVTLYPEIISYMTRSNTKTKRATDNMWKKITKTNKKRKSHKEVRNTESKKEWTTQHLIKIIDTNIDIDLDKSRERKRNVQNSYNKRFRIQSNLAKIEENKREKSKKSTIDIESEGIPKHEIKSSDKSKVDHFGSLYKLKYQKTPEMVYRGFRKSNDLVTLETKEINATNINENNTFTTKTYGTLAFWRGTTSITRPTAKSTIDKKTVSSEKIVIARNITTPVTNSIKTTPLNANYETTAIAHKNHTSALKHPKTETIESTQPAIHSINITKLSVQASRGLKSTENPEMIKQVDLRRFLNNSIINEVDEDPVKKKINDRFQEDLNKIFLVPPLQSPRLNDTNIDPIDEIEEAFNL